MRTVTVELDKGVTVGGVQYTQAVVREATAQDVIEATAEAERLVLVPVGLDSNGEPVTEPQFVTSPTMTGVNVLRRQVVSIGDHFKAPIEETIWAKLSPTDLNILQREANMLENVSLEAANRGRSDSESQAPEKSD